MLYAQMRAVADTLGAEFWDITTEARNFEFSQNHAYGPVLTRNANQLPALVSDTENVLMRCRARAVELKYSGHGERHYQLSERSGLWKYSGEGEEVQRDHIGPYRYSGCRNRPTSMI